MAGLFGPGPKPYVTWTLLAVNAVIWIALSIALRLSDGPRETVLLDAGGLSGPLIAEGQYWRLFTAMFLHADVLHLLLNSLWLFMLGRMVESLYGGARIALIYLLAGLAGSVTSYILTSTAHAVGVGASGAIFGILGALGSYFVANREALGEYGRQSFSGILVTSALVLVFGFLTPGIDNWAHLGGLIGGFAVGLALVPDYQRLTSLSGLGISSRVIDRNPLSKRWWVVPAAVVVLAAGTALGTATAPDSPVSHVNDARRHMEDGSFDRAFEELERALRLDPGYSEAYLLAGEISLRLGDVDRARARLFQALALATRRGEGDTAARARELLATVN